MTPISVTFGMKIVERKIADLIPSEYNPRTLTEKQHEDLEASLKRFGFIDPAIINKHPERKDIIIGGHQRLKVAQGIGMDKVPTVELKLTRDQERELNVRLNKNTGEFDFEILANEFEVNELKDWGFTEQELKIFEDEIPQDNREAMADSWFLNIEFTNEQECEEWYNKLMGENLQVKIVQ